MIERQIDAVVTVGAGDKMFWGRLAAYFARVPVIASALHSTGWPDGIGRLNRWLTPITDAFIAVADTHGQFLIDQERLPPEKVFVIPNGVDTSRFVPVFRGPSERSQHRRSPHGGAPLLHRRGAASGKKPRAFLEDRRADSAATRSHRRVRHCRRWPSAGSAGDV